MSVDTGGMGGGGDDPGRGRDDLLNKVIEHATSTARKRRQGEAKAEQQPPLKRQRQSVITNYFAPAGEQPPARADYQFVQDEVLAATMPVTVPDYIEVDGEEGEYGAKDTDTNEDVASLTLYWDEVDGIYWVNHIEVDRAYRRRGIATAMLRRACDEHGTIYFSLQTAEDDDAADTRHLTEEGFALARAASGDARLNCEMAQPRNVLTREDDDEEKS